MSRGLLKWIALAFVVLVAGGLFIGGAALSGSTETIVRYVRSQAVAAPLVPERFGESAQASIESKVLSRLRERTLAQASLESKALSRLRERVRKQHKLLKRYGDLIRKERAKARKVASRKYRAGQVIAFARKAIGTPYVWGGESFAEGGFDCSGLVMASLEAAGIEVSGRLTTYNVRSLGRSVPLSAIKPGDAVVTGSGGHMVLYEGGGHVISAPYTGATVKRDLLSNYSIVDIRRLF